MISKQERTKLRKVIPRYTVAVNNLLTKRKVVSRTGKPYSIDMIRNVFNGLNENAAIEKAIFDAYKNEIARQIREKQLRRKILK